MPAVHVHEAVPGLLLRADCDVAAHFIAVARICDHQRAAVDVEVVVFGEVACHDKRTRHFREARVRRERQRHALVDERAPICLLAQPGAVLKRERHALHGTEFAPEVKVECAVPPCDVAFKGGICHDAVHVAAEVKRAAALGNHAGGVKIAGESERAATGEIEIGGVDWRGVRDGGAGRDGDRI